MNANRVNKLWSSDAFQRTKLFSIFREQPLGFIDVGARDGVHPLVEPAAKGVAVLGFEPDPEGFKALENHSDPDWARICFDQNGLADTHGKAQLYMMTSPTNNSLRPTNLHFTTRYGMPKWKVEGEVTVDVTTLDNVLSSPQFKNESYWGELIKVDTQGTEFEILKGSEQTLLTRTMMVVAELEFFEIYKGQKLFSDVEIYMRSLGFSFYGFNNLFTRSRRGRPVENPNEKERWFYGDAVFLKDPFDRPSDFSERQLASLGLSCLLNNYYDLALEITDQYWPKDIDLIQTITKERLTE